MRITDILLEYITVYHGAQEHGERRIGHVGKNSTTFGNYDSTRYGVFFSDNPEFSKEYGEVVPYAIGVSVSQVVDLESSDVVGKFFDWAEQRDLKDIVFFIRHQYKEYWDLFEDDVGKTFLQFAQEHDIKVVKFTESLPTDHGEVTGTTYVVFDISLLKREPDARQPDFFIESDEHTVNDFRQSLIHKHKPKSLSLYMDNKNRLKLSMISLEKSRMGQGIGTKIMQEIIDFADQHGLTLTLTPAVKDTSAGTTSHNRLIRFYKQFGFVQNKGRNKDFTIFDSMYRKPK